MAQNKYQTSKQFSAELSKGLNGNIFLFIGEEEGEKDKVINSIINLKFSDENERIQNCGKYHISDDKERLPEFMSAADFILSGSMFSNNRVCIIRNIENIEKNDNVKNIIDDIFTSTPDGTIIIMTCMSNKIPGIIGKKYEDSLHVVQFWKNFDSDLFNYINKSLREKKVKFDVEIIPLIIELTGNDIKKIDEILDMISLISIDTPLSSTLLRDLAGGIREITVFEFIDSLFLKERRSLLHLKKLLNENTAELFILNMVIRQAELIEKYYNFIESNQSHEEALTRLGLAASKRRKEKFTAILKKINRDELKEIFPYIAKAEYKIKSSGTSYTIVNNPIFILASEIVMLKNE
jgi:DNA polymerase III delta subunit